MRAPGDAMRLKSRNAYGCARWHGPTKRSAPVYFALLMCASGIVTPVLAGAAYVQGNFSPGNGSSTSLSAGSVAASGMEHARQAKINLHPMSGFSGLKPNPPSNPHRMGRAVDAAGVPVLDSGEFDSGFIDLSAAARGIDHDSVGSARFRHLNAEHDSGALSASQAGSSHIRLNTRMPISLQSGCNHSCGGIAIDRKIHSGFCNLQRGVARIHTQLKCGGIHDGHRLAHFANTGPNEDCDQRSWGIDG